MKTASMAEVLALVGRVVLGVWFVYSGGVKVFGTGLDRFVYDVGNYRLVGAPWDAVVAYGVPWVEMVAGGCLMLGVLRRGALAAIAGVVVVFSVAVGWAWWHGLDISCGCHGGDAPMSHWGKVVEFSGYFVLLAWLWRMESGHALRRTSPATN